MKIRYVIAMLLLTSSCFAQNPVTIKGKLKNLDGHQIAVTYEFEHKKKRAIIDTKNDQFEISMVIDNPQEVKLSPVAYYNNGIQILNTTRHLVAPPLAVFVVPGDQISLDGDAMQIWNTQISGGTEEKAIKLFNRQTAPLTGQAYQLVVQKQKLINEGQTEVAGELDEQIHKLTDEKNKITVEFFTENPNSLYSMYVFAQKIKSIKLEEAEHLLAAYPKDIQNSLVGQQIKEYIDRTKRAATGQQVMDFNGKTAGGITFDSKSLRGKYVLLDFWGSWCKPCRASHPHLIELYQKYHSKGLEIVGIAYELSTAENNWKKAIEVDKINWIHLLNNQMQKDGQDVAKMYNVSAFPTKILIDRNGLIVWKGTGKNADELNKQLAGIFGE